MTAKGIQQAISSYKQNWLAVSGQKLFSNSLSHYLHSLCPQQYGGKGQNFGFSDSDSVASFEYDSSLVTCKCHSNYYLNYLEYLNYARLAIGQFRTATKPWKNTYAEPCLSLHILLSGKQSQQQ